MEDDVLRALEEGLDNDVDAALAESRWYEAAATGSKSDRTDHGQGSSFPGRPEADVVATRHHADTSSDDWDIGGAVAASFQDLSPEIPKQPWESGIWSAIFGEGSHLERALFSSGDLKRPAQPGGLPDSSAAQGSGSAKVRRTGPIDVTYLNAITAKPATDWVSSREMDMNEAVNEWTCFILTWPNCCEITEQIRHLRSFEEQCNMMYDVLGGKAPSTLRKRLRALQGYERVLREYYSEAFPGDESVLYNYLCYLRSLKKPSSQLKRLMEALTFTAYVLGVESLETVVKSRRCRGSSRSHAQNTRKPASPLTVLELQTLHDAAMSNEDAWNRVFAAACLLAVYARARRSDLMHGFEVFLDRDEDGNLAFVEVSVAVRVHKTMKSSNFRNTVLPLVAPASGIKEGGWMGSCRESLGIGDVPSFPVMPAPDHNKEPTVRPLESEEASKWMRYLLTGSMSKDPKRKLSSHSCKCTLLSYAAKFGVSTEERLVMGYHVSSSRMAHVYANNAAAPTILILEQILAAIRSGAFKPDSTRSGRFGGQRPQCLNQGYRSSKS